MPETAARLRYLRTSPTKIRPVLKLIAGQDIADARDTLRLCERGVARDVGKLLDSAVANAEHNDHVPEDELFVKRAYADEGPILKRWRPRARGRGVRINKRTSHITIVLSRFESDDLEKRRQASAAGVGRPRPTRRARPAVEHDHDHDDHDHDHEHEHDEDAAPAKRTVKKTTKKAAAASAASPTDDAGAGASRRRPRKPETTKKTAKKAESAKKTAKKAEPAKKAAKTTKKSTKKATKRAPKKDT
ncbi:MAG: 50S ribosomal protein L22 [Actinobacteria bacterium]|nr:50S ribosomal protein L22 [Actinomycetota bacterium]